MELPLEVTTRLNVLAAIMSLAILAVIVFGMAQRGTRLVGTAEARAMSTARRTLRAWLIDKEGRLIQCQFAQHAIREFVRARAQSDEKPGSSQPHSGWSRS